jgi:hypothetical protein
MAIIALIATVASSSAALAAGQPSYTVVSTASNGGVLAPLGYAGVMGGTTYPLTITPDPGYLIADVIVDGLSVGTTSLYAFYQVSANHTIHVKFAPIPAAAYDIAADAGPNGTISPLGTTTVTTGTDQSYAITPDAGFQVASLTIDGVPTAPSTSYTFAKVNAPHTISAAFSPLPTASSISINPIATSAPIGANLAFGATVLDQFSQPLSSNVTWTSSDNAIGSIDAASGLFTALSAGTVTISAASGNLAVSVAITVLPNAASLAAPANLEADALSPTQIKLSWKSPKNASIKEYRIYRRTGRKTISLSDQPIAITTANSYIDKGLNAGTTYAYAVVAVDTGGNISKLSKANSATTKNTSARKK